MKDIITDRGFRHAPIRGDSYGGTIRVYESSAASGPHVWINVVDFNGNEATVHLPLKTAKKFAKDIERVVKEHYHNA